MQAMRIISLFYFFSISRANANIAKRERFSYNYDLASIMSGLMGSFVFEFPYECRERGWYPDPYDCRNSIICDEITEVFNSQKEGNETDWCSSKNLNHTDSFVENLSLYPKHYPEGKVVVPTEYCTCPDGSYWGGPSAGCVDDNLEDMNACCNFKADCNGYPEEGYVGDFKNCSLSALEFNYMCFENDWGKKKLFFEKCLGSENASACSPDHTINLNDRKVKKYKIQPVCTLIRHLIDTEDSKNFELDSLLCTITFNKTSPDGPFPIVDDFKIHKWTIFNHLIAATRLRRIDPSFTETTDISDVQYKKHIRDQLAKLKLFE